MKQTCPYVVESKKMTLDHVSQTHAVRIGDEKHVQRQAFAIFKILKISLFKERNIGLMQRKLLKGL